MKTKLKVIVLSIVMFVAGIATAYAIGRFFVLPDLAIDIGKFGCESALEGYQAGYIDGENGNTNMYDIYFDEEGVDQILTWEYKYIYKSIK